MRRHIAQPRPLVIPPSRDQVLTVADRYQPLRAANAIPINTRNDERMEVPPSSVAPDRSPAYRPLPSDGLTVAKRGMLGWDHPAHIDELTTRYELDMLRAHGGIVEYVVGARPGPGVFCLAVPNEVTASLDLSAADLVVESLEDLPLGALLERVAASRRPR